MKSFTLLLLLLAVLFMAGCTTVSTQVHYRPSTAFENLKAITPSTPIVPVNPYVPKTIITLTSSPPLVVPPPVTLLNPREVACMADAIYHEARGESQRGQIAVGYVIFNRMHNSAYPPSACAVVHQAVVRHGRLVRGRCQFAWYCDGRPDTPKDAHAYAHAMELAKLVLLQFAPNPIGHSLYFHERTLRRRPHRRYVDTHRIGHQFFYSYAMRK